MDDCNLICEGKTEAEILALAEAGNAEAQFCVGDMYEKRILIDELNCQNGYSIYEDVPDHGSTLASEWYRKSAEQGFAPAQFALAYLYAEGVGIEANAEKSFELYLKAAEQGHAEAQYEVGLSYDKGYGVEENAEKAAEWYRKSAAQGNEFARRALEYAARARGMHD